MRQKTIKMLKPADLKYVFCDYSETKQVGTTDFWYFFPCGVRIQKMYRWPSQRWGPKHLLGSLWFWDLRAKRKTEFSKKIFLRLPPSSTSEKMNIHQVWRSDHPWELRYSAFKFAQNWPISTWKNFKRLPRTRLEGDEIFFTTKLHPLVSTFGIWHKKNFGPKKCGTNMSIFIAPYS